MSKSIYTMVQVKRPKNWKPLHLLDIPIGAKIMEVLEIKCSTEFAVHFNYESLRANSDLWCIVLYEEGRSRRIPLIEKEVEHAQPTA